MPAELTSVQVSRQALMETARRRAYPKIEAVNMVLDTVIMV